MLATGSDPGFETFHLKERLQKVERYSTQRPFTEYYRFKEGVSLWKVSAKSRVEALNITEYPLVKLLPRNILLPEFNIVHPVSICSRGFIQFKKPEKYIKHRSLTQISDKFKGYAEAELEVIPSMTVQEITTKIRDTVAKPFSAGKVFSMTGNEFCSFDLGTKSFWFYRREN